VDVVRAFVGGPPPMTAVGRYDIQNG
jgi:hypothetical protein